MRDPIGGLGSERPEPEARRVAMTLSCRDTDVLPKVPDAGRIRALPGGSVQVMHNGVLIEEGCYYGPWMTQIIGGLNGHHEPQEELVFDALIRRLEASCQPSLLEASLLEASDLEVSDLEVSDLEVAAPPAPTMIEFGSFWAYYSMWFCQALHGGRAVAMEPDPVYLQVGMRNAELNGLTGRIEFVHGAVGSRPGEVMDFRTESTGAVIPVVQHDLGSLLHRARWQRVDLVLLDIQGAETTLLEGARSLLSAGRVRFIVVSTHHQSISGDALTHQRALELLIGCGGHIIAEHTVRESFSGDGLIAASFDPADRDLTVPVSRARARESLFGEPEYEIAELQARLP